jgi:hypothetical protein
LGRAPTSSIARSATLSDTADAIGKVRREIGNLGVAGIDLIARYASTLYSFGSIALSGILS